VKDWGESASEIMIVKKQLQRTVNRTLLLGCFYLLYMSKILICLRCFIPRFKLSLGNCCWLNVCNVVVDMCLLLSYVYWFHYVCIVILL